MDMDSAAKSNQQFYDYLHTEDQFFEGSPHLKHESLRNFYLSLVKKCCSYAKSYGQSHPKVLDLGAGNGAATLAFILEGCSVTAVDISALQLRRFIESWPQHFPKCNIVQSEAIDYIHKSKKSGEKFDVIIFNSFLHHLPDYLAAVEAAFGLLNKRGVIFTFQDPIYYPTLPLATRFFSAMAYFIWRVRQPVLLAGLKRRFARWRGDFSDPMNDVEYHVVREGVNQGELMKLCRKNGLRVEYFTYFSTQSFFFYHLSSLLPQWFDNTFSLIVKSGGQ